MFVPAEMSEVDIFVFENDIEVVAQTVASLGVMHLLDANALGKWAENVSSEWAGRASAYRGQERRVLELLHQLGIEEAFRPCEGKLDVAKDLAVLEGELSEIESRVNSLREKEAGLKHELEHWRMVAKSMELLAPLSVSISDLRQSSQLHMVAGTIPSENLARLEASLFRVPYSIIPVHYYDGRVLIFAFCAEEHAPILDRALESAFLDPLALPSEYSGTAQEVLEQVSRQIEDAQAKLDELAKERQRLIEEVAPRLLSMLARIRRNAVIADAMAHFGHREHVYLIAGWVPKDRVKELREAIERAAEGRATIEENPSRAFRERVQVPTLLRNAKLFRPVEALVTTYGTPGYREIDPTPLIAVTFTLMFGIMFGDLGHGLVLAAIGLLLASRLVPQLSKQAGIGLILIACGLSSSVFGLLYGSFFGMEGVIPHLWLKPMHDILTLLMASVVLGVVILNIGFGCRLFAAARQGHFVEAIFDKNGLVGLLLYWGLVAIVLLIATGGAIPEWLFVEVMLCVFALFFSEPLTRLLEGKRPLVQGSALELGVQAFFELFEALISYISNTLSYVRLGAFAVAHAGLSTVVFLLADMIGSGSSGSVGRAAVIVFGNIFVIGFEGLIVAIQTLRLEYYEFFGKFFKGDGIPFRPLSLPSVECRVQELERSKP